MLKSGSCTGKRSGKKVGSGEEGEERVFERGGRGSGLNEKWCKIMKAKWCERGVVGEGKWNRVKEEPWWERISGMKVKDRGKGRSGVKEKWDERMKAKWCGK